MKTLNFYKTTLNCKNENEVFDYFMKNLKPSILVWSYFVNWEKVFDNTRKIEIALN
ncbi:Restriction endonuclease, type II, DpmII, partial [Candidatus Magnetoovum chiemensis]